MQWLLPRLNHFSAQCPGVDLRINISHELVDFERDQVDVAVLHGLGTYPGLCSEKLLDEPLIVVASPSLLASLPALKSANDLRHCSLLHDEDRNDWKVWAALFKATSVTHDKGPVFTGNGVMDAVLAGRGVALLRESFIRKELQEGKLVSVLIKKLKVNFAYYLVYPRSARKQAELESFRTWAIAESRRG
ncbi:hypothetical protein D3871_04340 [Noviherbaspirillum saxi]|uniref:LysR substrate-binding domain-containing protein n=1 Tax=Noviherbaspirillum saxi TaxID=2320863 RepID=A0A3A3FNP9_9BURK|nr:hypothetical protein D3871_04340 [Noviherbaspirillum saxi]